MYLRIGIMKSSFQRKLEQALDSKNVDELYKLCSDTSKKVKTLNFKDYRDKSLIHYAATFGSVRLLKALVDLGADVKKKTEGFDEKGKTTLHYACENGHIDVVDYLLKTVNDASFHRALSNSSNGKGYKSALYYAAKSGKIDLVRRLKSTSYFDINEVFPNKSTALFTSITENEYESAEILCRCGANVSLGIVGRGLQPIHYVIENRRHPKMLQMLLKYGANVNEPWGRQAYGQQPLFMSVKQDLPDHARILLNSGANVHFKGSTSDREMGWIGCFCLAAMRCPELIPDFLKHGGNPNEVHEKTGNSVLMIAMDNHAPKEVVKTLIKAGAKKGRRDKTAIQCCQKYGQLMVFRNAGVSVEEIEKQHKVSTLRLLMETRTGNRSEQKILSTVTELLSSGANPNMTPDNQDCPLILAIKETMLEVADKLIKEGADLNHVGKDGNTAVHFCSKNAKFKILITLIEAGASINKANTNGEYPLELVLDSCKTENYTNTATYLYRSIRQGGTDGSLVECVMKLLSCGADPNCTRHGRNSPLMKAVDNGLENVVKALLESGANVAHVGQNQMTAFDICVKGMTGKRNEIMKLLLEKGVQLNTADATGKYPLERLLDAGFEDSVIDQIVAQGADPNLLKLGEDSPLIKAVNMKYYKASSILIERKADIHHTDRLGWTAFDYFAEQVVNAPVSSKDVVDVLNRFMHHGIKVNEKTKTQLYPLLVAVRLHSAEMVSYLLENGADPNMMDDSCDTPLTFALEEGLRQIVELLLKSKVNTNHIRIQKWIKTENSNEGSNIKYRKLSATESEKTTSVIIRKTSVLSRVIKEMPQLSMKMRKDFVRLLIDHGANPNIKPEGWDSTLMHAVRLRDCNIVKILIDAGANVNHKGTQNFTALHTYFQQSQRKGHFSGSQNSEVESVSSMSVLKMLLQSKAQTTAMSTTQELPVHLALRMKPNSMKRHFDNIRMLLDNSSEINVPNRDGDPPLIVAAKFCSFELIQKMISLGADVNYKGFEGKTALHNHMDSDRFDKDVVSILVTHGANINAINEKGETVLLRYIKRGQENVSKENILVLIDKGADPSVCTEGRNSPLMEAIILDLYSIMECLITAKNLNHFREDGNTALHLALMKGKRRFHESIRRSENNLVAVQMLNARKRKPIEIFGSCPKILKGTYSRQTAGDVKLIIRSSTMMTPNKSLVTEAAVEDEENSPNIDNTVLDSIMLLLNHGAKVNIMNNDGKTPLYVLFENHGSTGIKRILPHILDIGADPNIGSCVPIVLAAQLNRDKAIKLLVGHKADVDKKTPDGETALLSVLRLCGRQHSGKIAKTVKVLLDCGASVNVNSKTGEAPLILPIINSVFKAEGGCLYYRISDDDLTTIITLMLEKGADPNNVKTGKDSPLMIAVECMLSSVAEVLIKFGANTNHVGKDDKTVLHKLFSSVMFPDFDNDDDGTVKQKESVKRLSVLKLLLENKADVNCTAPGCDSPLLLAIKSKELGFISLLPKAKADVWHKGKDNLNAYETCLQINVNQGLAVLDVLLDFQPVEDGMFFQRFWVYISSSEIYNRKNLETVSSKLLSGKQNIGVNFAKEGADSPLIYFCKQQMLEIVELLHLLKADVNHVGREGMTAVHHIVDIQDSSVAVQMLNSLIGQHARIDIKDATGQTVLKKVLLKISKRSEPLKYNYFHYQESINYDTISLLMQRLLEVDDSSHSDDLSKALFSSAKFGDFKAMISLVNHGADIHRKDTLKQTIVHICWLKSLDGASDFVQSYIRRGGLVNSTDLNGNTPLMALLKSPKAGKEDNRDEETAKIVSILVDNNVTFMADETGDTPLHIAVKEGLNKSIDILIGAGINVCDKNRNGDTALNLCLKYAKPNILEIATKLVKCDKTVCSLKNNVGQSPLFMASVIDRHISLENLSDQLIELLLKYGADPNCHSVQNIPLLAVVERGNVEAARRLLKAGANVNVRNGTGYSALHVLFICYRINAEGISTRMTKLLLKNGIDVNMVDVSGKSALHYAVSDLSTSFSLRSRLDIASGSAEAIVQTISELLDSRADIDKKDLSNHTALATFCCSGSKPRIGKLLLEKDADTSTKNYLELALQNKHCNTSKEEWVDFLCFLLHKGANPNICTRERSNLIEATMRVCPRLVEKILQHCDLINYCDSKQKTALHYACSLKPSSEKNCIVNLLVTHGANLNAQTRNGEKPLDILVKNIIEYLKSEEIKEDKDRNPTIEVDLSLFNRFVRGGSDLYPVEFPLKRDSLITGAIFERFTRLDNNLNRDQSVLRLLVKNGLLRAAEYLIHCGWKTESEKWLHDVNSDQDNGAIIEINHNSYHLRDYKSKIAEFMNIVMSINEGRKSLSMQCRTVIRNQLIAASSGSEIQTKINLLPVPEKIKSYLALYEFAVPIEKMLLEKDIGTSTVQMTNYVNIFRTSLFQSSVLHHYTYDDDESNDSYDDSSVVYMDDYDSDDGCYVEVDDYDEF